MASHLRLVSIFSLLVVICIAIFAGMSLRSMATADLVALVEKNGAGITEGYVVSVWKNYRDIIVPAAATDPTRLRNNPQVVQFAQDTVRYFQSLPVLRVNIYSAQGALLMTTNASSGPKLKAMPASPDAAFVTRQFKQPGASSQLLSEQTLEGGIIQAAVVQTITPMPGVAGSAIDGSVEIIFDITGTWNKLGTFQMYLTVGTVVFFLLFLLVLFFISRQSEVIIAKQHEANQELAAAAAAAQAENREKSQFLANISHELRTPLNAIIGFSEVIKTEVIAPLPEKKYHDYISDIHGSGVHLLSLINDILDYSKAEAGKLEMEVAEVNATKLVQNCMRLVSPRAETAKVSLVEALPKDAIIMLTDGKKLKQILLNLLSNAVKFTPAGGEIRVSAWRDVADDTYAFEVRDSGIGIAPKDIARAMTPFGQVDSSLNRKYEGTGLGLPLTKKFVELMSGKFSIESKINVGTTITFVLPRELKEREGLVIKQAAE